MPRELNLSPLYYHRLDRDGTLRELEVIWPIVHYERTDRDGDDFRIRPLYRRVTDPAREAVDHQFLWPLGRVRHDPEETHSRLFPLWSRMSRLDGEGRRDVDWYFTPLIWGGWSEDGDEDYLAVLPFYADIPQFLTYDRFRTVLFPLWVGLDKGTHREDIFLWPLFATGGDPHGEPRRSGRVLPFYGASVHEGRFARHSALWPFVHWGTENLDTDNPSDRFFLFPVFGRQTGPKVDSWTALWPLFQKMEIRDRLYKLDILWPVFRYHRDTSEFSQLHQWWVWPLYGRTETDDQRAWSALWPLIWFREYDDPEGTQTQDWILPFYWHTHRNRDDGTEDDFLKLWPLFHRSRDHGGNGDWSLLSIWPWHHGNAEGVEEAWGWLWTLAKGRETRNASNMELAAKLFTTAERDGLRQTSVPFLFSYERDDRAGGAATLRLLQFLPISLGGAEPEADR